MQLVEQGKLNLDEDVNRYLDFHIPDAYPQPITLRHLMNHNSILSVFFAFLVLGVVLGLV
jgi:CubicO group peptidase (beta-lactamase class C family)